MAISHNNNPRGGMPGPLGTGGRRRGGAEFSGCSFAMIWFRLPAKRAGDGCGRIVGHAVRMRKHLSPAPFTLGLPPQAAVAATRKDASHRPRKHGRLCASRPNEPPQLRPAADRGRTGNLGANRSSLRRRKSLSVRWRRTRKEKNVLCLAKMLRGYFVPAIVVCIIVKPTHPS